MERFIFQKFLREREIDEIDKSLNEIWFVIMRNDSSILSEKRIILFLRISLVSL